MSTVTDNLEIYSLERRIDTDPSRFGFLEASNDALDDPAVLRARLEQDGYLFIKRFFDPELILEARRSMLSKMEREGLLEPGIDLMGGVLKKPYTASNFRPGLAWNDPAVMRVVFGSECAGLYTNLFGVPVAHFDFIWLRAVAPGPGTAAHCDWVYMSRGSEKLLTCWIPYGEIPLEVGGLMLLERSHLHAERIANYLSKDVDTYCENRPEEVERVAKEGGWSHRGWLSSYPDSLPEKFGGRWLTAEKYEPGDLLTFNMTMIHGSLDNHSDQVRLSTDTRWQPADEAIDERWIGANPIGHSTAGKRGRIC